MEFPLLQENLDTFLFLFFFSFFFFVSTCHSFPLEPSNEMFYVEWDPKIIHFCTTKPSTVLWSGNKKFCREDVEVEDSFIRTIVHVIPHKWSVFWFLAFLCSINTISMSLFIYLFLATFLYFHLYFLARELCLKFKNSVVINL